MKKVFFIVSVIVLLFAINSLARSIYDLWQKQDLLKEAQKDLEEEKLKNQKLKASLSYAQSPEFLEEQARNKLFLAKPGEQQVVIPIREEKKPQKKEETPNWKKWLAVFAF